MTHLYPINPTFEIASLFNEIDHPNPNSKTTTIEKINNKALILLEDLPQVSCNMRYRLLQLTIKELKKQPEEVKINKLANSVLLKERLLKYISPKELYQALLTKNYLLVEEAIQLPNHLVSLMQMAIQKKNYKAIDALWNIQTDHQTPLHFAVQHLSNSNIIDLIKLWPEEKKDYLFSADEEEQTPLDLALENHSLLTITPLLELCPHPEFLLNKKNAFNVLSKFGQIAAINPEVKKPLFTFIERMDNPSIEVKIVACLNQKEIFPEIRTHLLNKFSLSLELYVEYFFEAVVIFKLLFKEEVAPNVQKILLQKLLKIQASKTLNLAKLNAVLQLLPPNEIYNFIRSIPDKMEKEALDETIFFDESFHYLFEIVIILKENLLPLLINPELENVTLEDIHTILNKIPPTSLSVLTRLYLSGILPLIPYMEDRELTVCLPFIPVESLLTLPESVYTSDRVIKKCLLEVKKEIFTQASGAKEEYFTNLLKGTFSKQQSVSLDVHSKEIEKFHTAFLQGVCDQELEKLVEDQRGRVQAIVMKLKSSLQQTPLVPTPEKIPKRFQDSITSELMKNPCKIPDSNEYIDRKNLNSLRQPDGKILNPFNRNLEPETAYKTDKNLKRKIQRWVKKHPD